MIIIIIRIESMTNHDHNDDADHKNNRNSNNDHNNDDNNNRTACGIDSMTQWFDDPDAPDHTRTTRGGKILPPPACFLKNKSWR